MDTSKQPEYPCFYISLENWNDRWSDSLVTDDAYVHITHQKVIDDYILNSRWIDCKGDIYKVVGIDMLGWWRRLIPFVAKSKMIMQSTGECMTLEEFKAYKIQKIYSLNWSPDLDDLKDRLSGYLQVSKSFMEVMHKGV